MLSQLAVAIEAMELLISPGNLELFKKDITSFASTDELDIILEKGLKDYFEKINRDPKFSSVSAFWLNRKSYYFSSNASFKWKFTSTCLILIEILIITLKEISEKYNEKTIQQKQGHVNKGNTKGTAPRLSADTLSIEKQKVFMSTLQFIICLGVYPHLAKGVGIPLELRSGYGLMLSSSKPEAQSILERQYRLLLIARVFSACLDMSSLRSLFLSRHLGDCLAVMFQLCYGVKKYPLQNSTMKLSEAEKEGGKSDLRELSFNYVVKSSNFPADIDLNRINLSTSVESAPTLSNGTQIKHQNNSESHNDSATYFTIITDQDIAFCNIFLENVMNRTYQPSLIKELLLLQGVRGPKLVKKLHENNPEIIARPISSNFNLSPAPSWLKNACSKNLTKILLMPNGVIHVIKGMLDAPISQEISEIQYYKKCDAVAKVIANVPTSQNEEEYYNLILPQVIALLHTNDKQMSLQLLRIACCTMNIVSIHHSDIFVKYCMRKLFSSFYFCIEYSYKENTLPYTVIISENELYKSLQDCHKIFVSGCEPQASFLYHLKSLIHVIFCLYCYADTSSSDVKKLSEEILLTYLKFLDPMEAIICLKVFTFNTLYKGSNFTIPLMHQSLKFSAGNNSCTCVVNSSSDNNEQLDFLCDESGLINNLINLLSKLDKEKLLENFFINMLQELTLTLTSKPELVSDSMCHESSKEWLDDCVKNHQENTDGIFYQLTILNFLAAVYQRLGPSSVKSTKYVLEFIEAALVKSNDKMDDVEQEFGGIFTNEILTMSLGLLTAVVAGAIEITFEDQKLMRTFIPLLQNVIITTDNISIKAMASSLRIAIATYGAVWPDMKSATMLTADVSAERTNVYSSKESKIVKMGKNSSIDSSNAKKYENNVFSTNTSKELIENSKAVKNQSSPLFYSHDKSLYDGKVVSKDISFAKDCRTQHNVMKSNAKITLKNEEDSSYQEKISQQSELQMALKDTYDPLVPVQGHGLIVLTKLIQNKNKEAAKKQDLILHVFEEKLTHPDSYIYLSALNGLAAMADYFPDKVVPRIIDVFRDPELEIQNGEAVAAELKIKLGECLVKVSHSLGTTISKFKNILLNAFLQSAKDDDCLVRASSLSNLGEVCKLLRFSLGNVIHEIFSCCSTIVKFDANVEVRAAAVLLITQLLQGLGKDTFIVLEHVLKDLYRLLKSINIEEKEETVKLHANLALIELDELMRTALFPQQVFTKKICVLDPE